MEVFPSISIEIRVEHSDVDGLLDAPGHLVIFLVEGLYTLHGDLVVWQAPKALQLSFHLPVIMSNSIN